MIISIPALTRDRKEQMKVGDKVKHIYPPREITGRIIKIYTDLPKDNPYTILVEIDGQDKVGLFEPSHLEEVKDEQD